MRIGIASDSPAAVNTLRQILAERPEHQIVWVAADGTQAVAACARDTPDLVLMKLALPRMDGVEATRRIMGSNPCAILIITANVDADAARVCEAMGNGALDAVDAPGSDARPARSRGAALLAKIDIIGRLVSGTGAASLASGGNTLLPLDPRPVRLVAVGASAGGPAALATMLSGLPADFAAAVVIVQHVDEQFASGMAAWLNGCSRLPVRVAREGERPTIGTVLLAASADHLVLTQSGRLAYTRDPADSMYRPSVDVFFRSVSRVWARETVGVLLTGMGRDGALGLKAMRDKGCHTITQDEVTSAVYGMPKAAAALGAATEILALERIAPRLKILFAGSG